MPDTAEYLARIRDHALSGGPLEFQRHTPGLITELMASASPKKLTERPTENKWSIAEILAHLAEDEIATAWRYRQMVEHDGIDLAGFDQDLWARLGNYRSRSPHQSLQLFQLLRAANLAFLEQLSPGQWDCCGMHAERGRITVRDLAAHMAGHDANHVEQIRRILGAA